ncbi:hypothetical protein [Saccharopolyspora shandongensis]
MLTEDIVEKFVADQRRRMCDRLPSMRPSYNTKPPTSVPGATIGAIPTAC